MTSLTYNRRGFTFTEVMFAVILLGIGFIMLAGMFPVAIQQTQTNVEESTGSTIVQAARHYLEQTMTVDDMLPTGNLDPTKGPVVSPRFLRLSEYHDVPTGNPLLNGYLWEKVRGGFILSQDPRYAWTALYKRNPGDNFAHVIIFALQARNYSTYDSNDTVRYPVAGSGPLLASLEPRFIHAYLSDGGRPGEADIIEFFGIGNDGLIRDGPNGPQSDDGAVTEGCFVVVSDDGVLPPDDLGTPYFDPGYANGRIYRIGSRRRDKDLTNGITKAWELMPGHDMQSLEENLPPRQSPHGSIPATPNYTDHKNGASATVFIVGRGFNDPHTNPATPDTNFTGFAQDIAVYTTFIRLK